MFIFSYITLAVMIYTIHLYIVDIVNYCTIDGYQSSNDVGIIMLIVVVIIFIGCTTHFGF